ncbi:Uncharacterised protein [Bordetella pertussis]|nr:Uncharacterised protein [Bordetella pertussis]
MAALDGAVLDCVQDLQRGHDLAGGKRADAELAVRGFAYVFGQVLAAREDSIGAAGKAGGQAPVDGGGILRQGGGCQGCATGGGAQCGLLEERTALHYGCLLGVEECAERGPFA